jgi:hypothetical protein
MRNFLAVLALTILAIPVLSTSASAVDVMRYEYFLAADLDPQVYVGREVFFLAPWGGTTPSASYIEVCTAEGMKYQGRLIRISDREMALSLGYGVKKTGQRVEKQVVIHKKDVVVAWIYW